jgi:hypothetical protein
MQCHHSSPRYGQCPEDAMEQQNFCPLHFSLTEHADENQQYHLLKYKYRERTAQMGGHEKNKSLQNEIAIASMLLEERINSVHNDAELTAASGAIATQLALLEKLKTASQKLELASGNLITKATLMTIASEIVTILLEELADVNGYTEIVDTISNRIFTVIASTKNTDT